MHARVADPCPERHLELARRAAALVHPRVRRHVPLDELVALGNAGLAEAARRFDPGRGIEFPIFAWRRVLGAVLDGVRRSAPLPRRTWARLVVLRGEADRVALSEIRTSYASSLEALLARGFDAEADAPALPERIDAARRAHRLRAALAALPARQRALVAKHYWEGKSLQAAGAELGVSRSWASRMHAQAVARLAQAVRGAEEPDPRRATEASRCRGRARR